MTTFEKFCYGGLGILLSAILTMIVIVIIETVEVQVPYLVKVLSVCLMAVGLTIGYVFHRLAKIKPS